MPAYANALKIAEVEKLQKEILELVKKIHNPLRTFAAFLLASFGNYLFLMTDFHKYVIHYFAMESEVYSGVSKRLTTLKRHKDLCEKMQSICFSNNPAKRKLISLHFQELGSLYLQEPTEVLLSDNCEETVSECFKIMQNIIGSTHELIKDEYVGKAIAYSLENGNLYSIVAELLCFFPVSMLLINHFRNGLLLNYPLGFLPFCNSKYNNKELILISYSKINKITRHANSQRKDSLIRLKNDIALTYRNVQFFSMAIIMLSMLIEYLVYDEDLTTNGLTFPLFLAFILTSLTGIYNEALKKYENYKINSTIHNRLGLLNKISKEVGCEKWETYPKNAPSMFYVKLNTRNDVTKKQAFRALQLAFSKNEIIPLSIRNNQIVLNLDTNITDKKVLSINADFNCFLKEEKSNDNFKTISVPNHAVEIKESHETVETKENDGQKQKPHKRKRTAAPIKNTITINNQDEKTDDRPVKIKFGKYGSFDSKREDGEIIELHAHCWPRYSHFGIFTVKKGDFKGNEATYDKFKSIFKKGNVVPTRGYTGIIRSKETIRIHNEWAPIFHKVKAVNEDMRICQITPDIPADNNPNARLHVFDYVVHKSHR